MDTEKLFDHVEVLYHSSIRITGEKTVYIDPFGVTTEPRDADLILITHDHFDHFSPEDIAKVRGRETVIVTPASTAARARELGFGEVITMGPGIPRRRQGWRSGPSPPTTPTSQTIPGRTAGLGTCSP